MGQQREFEVDGVVVTTVGKTLVPVVRNDRWGDGGEAVAAEAGQEPLARFCSAYPFGDRHFFQKALESVLKRQALGVRSIYINAPHHLVFGAPCPVGGVPFGAKCFDGGRPAALADDALPRPCWRLDESRRGSPPCTPSVPKV